MKHYYNIEIINMEIKFKVKVKILQWCNVGKAQSYKLVEIQLES